MRMPRLPPSLNEPENQSQQDTQQDTEENRCHDGRVNGDAIAVKNQITGQATAARQFPQREQ
jgi:hypothetical protein